MTLIFQCLIFAVINLVIKNGGYSVTNLIVTKIFNCSSVTKFKKKWYQFFVSYSVTNYFVTEYPWQSGDKLSSKTSVTKDSSFTYLLYCGLLCATFANNFLVPTLNSWPYCSFIVGAVTYISLRKISFFFFNKVWMFPLAIEL